MKRKISTLSTPTEIEAQPWAVYVDGKLVSRTDRHRIAQSIIKALTRMPQYESSKFDCRFEGKNKGRRDESELIG